VRNDLPPHVTSAPLLATFRQRLKSFLFSQSYSDIHLTHIAFIFVNLAIIDNYLGHTKNYDDDDDDEGMKRFVHRCVT